jgi:diguanylate cyclase (GGDEF)-like protein
MAGPGTPQTGEVMATDGVVDGLRHAFRYLALAMIVLGLVIAALFGYVLGSLRPNQLRYTSGDRAVQMAHAAMIDQETGLRGYLLTHQAEFLQPYHQGTATLTTENAIAEQKLGSDPAVAPQLLNMRVAEQAWISEWAQAVAANQAPTDPTQLVAFLNQGKTLFDAYRAQEQALSDTINNKRDTLQGREGWSLGIGLGLVLAVGAVLAVMMARQRRVVRDMVIAPVDAIVKTTDRMATGDFDVRIEGVGPAEFQRIADSVNQMGDALARAREGVRAHQASSEQREQQLRKLLTMAREIAGSLSLRYVLRSVASSAASISGLSDVTVWLCDRDEATQLTAVFNTATGDAAPVGARTAESGIGVVGQAVKYGRTTTEALGEEPSVEVHPERPLQELAVPLIVGARVSGALEFSSPTPTLLEEGSLELLETLAIHAAAAIEAARLHSQAEELGRTDGLTGMANRRTLDTDLADECERTARYQRPLALIMFDVDYFKRFNDTFGHQRGDEVLQELAETVRRELRATDTAYRYGGEEFAVLARETTAEQASALAERLRARIEEHFQRHGSLAPITASFGVGLVPPGQPQPERLIASADAALYRAKAAGRNNVQAEGSTVT